MTDRLTTDQENRLRSRLQDFRLRDQVVVLLMLDIGLRVGETVGLLIQDVVFQNSVKSQVLIRPAISKSKKSRLLPLTPALADTIQAHLRERHKQEGLMDPLSPLITPRGKGKNLTVRQAQNIIKNIGIEALGFPIHPHTLRHTFASNLLAQSNVRIVQEALGHKKMSTTEVYTHPDKEEVFNAINRSAEKNRH